MSLWCSVPGRPCSCISLQIGLPVLLVPYELIGVGVGGFYSRVLVGLQQKPGEKGATRINSDGPHG